MLVMVEVARIELGQIHGLPAWASRSIQPLPPFLPLHVIDRGHPSALMHRRPDRATFPAWTPKPTAPARSAHAAPPHWRLFAMSGCAP